MSRVKKAFIIVLIVIVINLLLLPLYGNSDSSGYAPYTKTKVELNDTYTLFAENTYFKYYYKKHNGTLMVEDKRNNHVWKSGIDHDYDQYIEKTLELYLENNPEATDEEILNVAKPIEDQMNTTREGIANSLVVIDVLRESDPARAAIQAGSSYKAFSTRESLEQPGTEVVLETSDSVNTDNLYLVNGEENHYVFEIKYKEFKVDLVLHLYLTENGFEVEIRDHEIKGNDSNFIKHINIMPFLGSYGGKMLKYNTETDKYDIPSLKERKEGYAFVPDGPGALIEFKDYESQLSGYTGTIYGGDLAERGTNYNVVSSNVPTKNPLMPVYGISYRDNNAAFLSYATKGMEHMEIISRPNDSADSYNLTNYTITFPRFIYNDTYSQVYNKQGDSFITAFEERNHFDVRVTYHFLADNNSFAPDYVGMAKAYQTYLIEENILKDKQTNTLSHIPIRLDFVMADASPSLVATRDVVVTKIEDVSNILSELSGLGIHQINSGLLGYQRGGITLGEKAQPDFMNAIGSKSEFKNIVSSQNENGTDISLALDYVSISDINYRLANLASKHINGQYLVEIDPLNNTGVTNSFFYARSNKIISWIKSNEKAIRSLGFRSMTFDGFTKNLYSDNTKDRVSTSEVIGQYQDTLETISDNYIINNTTPNQYLWAYTDRFLQTPMFNSQYIVETHTVPFLQLVLNGYIEMYSTYVNFSFYEQRDILKMIDYHTFPSFLLTKEPSYLLQKTNSQAFFSTEYQIYQSMILDVYQKINGALSQVNEAGWVNREEISPNMIKNTYDNGKIIIINYTEEPSTYNQVTIPALDYVVIGG